MTNVSQRKAWKVMHVHDLDLRINFRWVTAFNKIHMALMMVPIRWYS